MPFRWDLLLGNFWKNWATFYSNIWFWHSYLITFHLVKLTSNPANADKWPTIYKTKKTSKIKLNVFYVGGIWVSQWYSWHYHCVVTSYTRDVHFISVHGKFRNIFLCHDCRISKFTKLTNFEANILKTRIFIVPFALNCFKTLKSRNILGKFSVKVFPF